VGSEMCIRDRRKILREEAGTRYTFRVLREGREKELKLKLKDLL